MNSDIHCIRLGRDLFHPYIFTTEYLYIDREDYFIDQIIEDSDIRFIKFNKYEGTHPNHPGFKICMVKCFRWDAEEMEKVLRKLDWKLIVNFGKNYTEYRDELFGVLTGKIDPKVC